MTSNNSLRDVFQVDNTPVDVVDKQGQLIPQAPDISSDNHKNVEHDYAVARGNLHKILQQGQEALTKALEVAISAEHPRAFEVVGDLVQQLASANLQLMELTEKKNKAAPLAPQTASITNNAYFVGSTTDLNKAVQTLLTKGNS